MELSEIQDTLDELPAVHRHRVLYGEVDKMNVAYGSHYLTWFERARNEYLRLCGLPYTLIEQRGLLLPVTESRVWHLAPVRYDDLLEFRAAVTDCTQVVATFLVSIDRDGERVAAGYTRHACLNGDRRPTRLPVWLREGILRRLDAGI
ncbi:MAG: acyl-CoA thioesterase [Planctomycetota bacterium]